VGRGVVVRPGSLCSWTVDARGFTLWLDLRCGGSPVRLGDRELLAARIVGVESTGDAWDALGSLIALMASAQLASRGPIVGANNWYYAYGRGFNEAAVVGDARTVVELADGHPVLPFSVVDDGWNPGGPPSYGPWNGTADLFEDLAGTAAAIREVGARPGIWFRPLASAAHAEFALARPGRTSTEVTIDPSIASVLDQVEQDITKFRDWGFDLLKHDFSTWDVLGRWGSQMGAELTDSGWAFADPTRTTAEILIGLYERIRDAAGSALVLGCNVVGHLAAGLVDIQRTGDDTSGRNWERTRRMGINTLAFRLPQHDRFFAVDADCVPCTPETLWSLNRQFLDLIARSGTALFVSIDPASRTDATDRDLSSAIRLALDGGDVGGIRPLDWMRTTAPARWASGTGTVDYDWNISYGANPFEV
jgi:alpha-galactosidase